MGNPEIYPEHLTLALLDQELPQQLVPDAELRAGRDDPARQAGGPGRCAAAAGRGGVLASSTRRSTRRKLEDEYVSTEHLLLALDVVPRDELLAKLNRCAAASASPARTPRARTRRSRSSAAT